jgi:hypothetical protein
LVSGGGRERYERAALDASSFSGLLPNGLGHALSQVSLTAKNISAAPPGGHVYASSGRRAFLRRALGAASVASGAALAAAGDAHGQVGTSIAYADATNTFTANQRVDARLGIGAAPTAPLQVKHPAGGPAVRVDPHTMGLAVVHDTDWAGQTFDLVNLFHKSTGDGVFVAHLGGTPPGYSGSSGGDAGLNALVPYFLDDTSDGRTGTQANNRTGMKGLHIETQAVTNGSRAIDVQHFSNDYGMYMVVQPPGYGQPVGAGGPLRIDDYSKVASIQLDKWTAASDFAILDISAHTSQPQDALWVRDNNAGARFRVRSDGLTRIIDGAGNIQLEANSNGQLSLGSGFGSSTLQYQGAMRVGGIARNVALVNQDAGAGSGTSIEFNDSNAQYAGITASYDNRNSGARAASLSFRVRSNDTLTERLRLNGTGIGFYGTTPAPRPTITGSRGGNVAVTRVIAAFAAIGLVTDKTKP